MSFDINHLIDKSIKGDENSKDELLIRLKPVILASIKRYYNRYELYDDLIQEGYELILKALSDYDREKGVHFLGYVKTFLRYHYLNKYNGDPDVVSLNQPIGDEKDIELIDTVVDNKPTPEAIIIRNYEINELLENIHSLTEKQRQIIILYYIEENSIGQISKKLNISYRTVVNIKTNAVKKLRNKLKKN